MDATERVGQQTYEKKKKCKKNDSFFIYFNLPRAIYNSNEEITVSDNEKEKCPKQDDG